MMAKWLALKLLGKGIWARLVVNADLSRLHLHQEFRRAPARIIAETQRELGELPKLKMTEGIRLRQAGFTGHPLAKEAEKFQERAQKLKDRLTQYTELKKLFPNEVFVTEREFRRLGTEYGISFVNIPDYKDRVSGYILNLLEETPKLPAQLVRYETKYGTVLSKRDYNSYGYMMMGYSPTPSLYSPGAQLVLEPTMCGLYRVLGLAPTEPELLAGKPLEIGY